MKKYIYIFQAVVCEYGDARLKHLISRRYCTAAGRTRRSIEERVAMGGALVGEGGIFQKRKNNQSIKTSTLI